MADQKTLIRIMGESDIVDVTMTRKAASHALLMGLDAADRVNLLGHWMDQDRGAELAADQNHLDADADRGERLRRVDAPGREPPPRELLELQVPQEPRIEEVEHVEQRQQQAEQRAELAWAGIGCRVNIGVAVSYTHLTLPTKA